jgi:phosphatidylserine/phosphatidylglycerophosphate/cardiolipin synthase-like enzyme
LIAFCAVLVLSATSDDPPYDHQTKTYVPSFKPVGMSGNIAAMPFFSPDHSIDTAVYQIQNATHSIDISTPGFSSWSGCTSFEDGCVGCELNVQRNESFPVFAALLNAVHRGVQIRLLTNNYNTPTCKGKIAPMDWLAANGVQIRYYTSTTFTHSKYLSTDGTMTSISSVNFSETSFLKNREAGVVLGAGAESMIEMGTAVFNNDWSNALDYGFDPSLYSSSELAEIRSTAPYTVVMPPQPNIPGSYVTPQPEFVQADMKATVFASPDFSFDTVTALLNSATSSIDIYIYQVTDDALCQQLITLNSKVTLRLLVSAKIYDETDWKAAQVCYKQMYTAGLHPRRAPSFYSYSHQKFFIIDNTTVSVSTGNFSPSDYPQGASFPPYGQSGWQPVNRDYSLVFTQPDIVETFQTVLEQDWQRGSDWKPT